MNLSFLSPLFLIGLAAIALPIIAHLISRKSGVKKSFPAVNFLISSQGELATRSKIKDIILLILRALILVFIVLVFAKPAVFSFSTAQDNTPKSQAIVVDNSFSMGYGNNFSRALSKTQDLIDSLPDGSSAFITSLVPDNKQEPPLIQDKTLLKKALKEIEISNTFTENEKRLQDIYTKLQKAPSERKGVTLITDLQKNGWKNEGFQRSWLEVIDISQKQEASNHAVSQTQLKYENNSIIIEAEVSNFSSDPVQKLLMRTSLGDQEIREFLDIGPEDGSVKKFNFSTEKTEMPSHGSVETSHDKLKVDDIRHFIINGQDQFRILIVDGDSREDSRLCETYYLARALETISELSDTNISIIDNDSFLDEDLSGYGLIFLANIGEITPRIAKDLEEFTNSGGYTVIFLGNRVRAGYYNTLLENILPGELQNIEEQKLSLLPEDSGIFSKDINEKVGQVKIQKLFNIEPNAESATLISASNNKPFLVKKEYGKGSVFIFTSTADSSWNNFSITPVFLPVIKKIHDFPYYTKSQRNYLVDETVNIDISQDTESAIVIDPSGHQFKLKVEAPEFGKTRLPGIYIVEEDGENAYEFVVNIDPRESDLKKTSIPSIESSSEQTQGLVKVFKDIWRYFLWGVVALFVSEATFRAIFS
ncbi:MAG: BatA domain-containing protein [Deltaproteobacteria bacterium]|nr:BatA domain-containing protein [Deltaproteobacteria bacterium]